MNDIIMQLTEYCQKCQKVQNINGAAVDREEITADGETITIVTISYHCEACHTYIRSEELEPKRHEIS